jgi:hypothetical protein
MPVGEVRAVGSGATRFFTSGAMILAFEMNSMGTHHAPFNSATLQTFSHAVPDQTIRLHAHVSYLRELRATWATRRQSPRRVL